MNSGSTDTSGQPVTGIGRLNTLPAEAALDLLQHCSHSPLWSRNMLARRPFRDPSDLAAAAALAWEGATEATWLEAFAGHPQIGDVDYLRRRFDARARGEQGQVLGAPTAVLEELARLNRDYRERHGFIFIIRASGLTAAQMLDALRVRLPRTRDTELAEAARQHAAITFSRLEDALRT